MMFGTVVMKVDPQEYEEVLREERAACGVGDNSQLDIKSLQIVVYKFKKLAGVCTHTARLELSVSVILFFFMADWYRLVSCVCLLVCLPLPVCLVY
jgi:hypothetical protein